MEDREESDGRQYQRQPEVPESERRSWAGLGTFVISAVIGAAIVGNILSLRKRLMNFQRVVSQGNSSGQSASEKPGAAAQRAARRAQGRQRRPPEFYEVGPEDVKRFWEQHLREMERIRRVQQAFENEKRRARRNRDYDAWQEAEAQGFSQTWEWRWEGGRWVGQRQTQQRWTEGDRRWADEESQWRRTESDFHPSLKSSRHHYIVLGLDPSKNYTEAEIKAAFRAKAMVYHPDRNQTNKEEAAEKFRQVTEAYNALKGK
ncbi:hypothetical protein R1sor_018078 [Riccia sorocarpa]|uniref:J domain-containing protein n=1 Tax=Riccia sorocarpa TaxID=122646 RepID=A0ABD3I934_9MARC